MNESMTVIEVLNITRDILLNITVKVADMQTIGQPVHAAVGNLSAVIEAMSRAETKPEEAQAENEDDHHEEGDA